MLKGLPIGLVLGAILAFALLRAVEARRDPGVGKTAAGEASPAGASQESEALKRELAALGESMESFAESVAVQAAQHEEDQTGAGDHRNGPESGGCRPGRIDREWQGDDADRVRDRHLRGELGDAMKTKRSNDRQNEGGG